MLNFESVKSLTILLWEGAAHECVAFFYIFFFRGFTGRVHAQTKINFANSKKGAYFALVKTNKQYEQANKLNRNSRL